MKESEHKGNCNVICKDALQLRFQQTVSHKMHNALRFASPLKFSRFISIHVLEVLL